jgi:hypothetical protein
LSWTTDRAEAVAFLEASKGTSTCCPWARSGRRKQPPKPLNTSASSSVQQHARVFPELDVHRPATVSGGADYVYAEPRTRSTRRPLCSAKTFIEGRFKSERYVGDLNKLVNKNSLTTGYPREQYKHEHHNAHGQSRVFALQTYMEEHDRVVHVRRNIQLLHRRHFGRDEPPIYTRLIYRCLRVGKSPT